MPSQKKNKLPQTLQTAKNTNVEDLWDQIVFHIIPTYPKDALLFSGLMVVGEAPGREEERDGVPWVGGAGRILRDALRNYGNNLLPERCWLTNVFKERPPANKIHEFFDTVKYEETEHLGRYTRGWLIPGYYPNIVYLWKEIIEFCQPKAVLACGNTPLWFFRGVSGGITKHLGETDVLQLPHGDVHVVYTLHPAVGLYGKRDEVIKQISTDVKTVKKYL